MSLSFIQCLGLAFVYWLQKLSYGYSIKWSPVVFFLGMGLFTGQWATTAVVCAGITPLFLAFTGAGGTVVWDADAGKLVGVAVVVVSGISVEQAVAIAMPIAILAAQLHTIRRIWFAVPAQKADAAALRGDDKAIVWYGGWFCNLSKIVIYLIPMFLVLYFGAEQIGDLMAKMPAWINNALGCAGGILPSLGFAMTVRVIGRPKFLGFFLAGYFLAEYTGVGGVFLACIGLFVSFLYYLIVDASIEGGANMFATFQIKSDQSNEKHLLTMKDVHNMWWRWQWWCEVSNSFSRLQSIAYCISYIPCMKKLYGHDPEEYSAALQRHLMFFNTQGIWGSVVHGIALAMEEQRALGAPIDVSAITGVKAGLMGPFAGIGDTIDWATLSPLLQVLFLPMAQNGNILGLVLPWIVLSVIVSAEGYYFSALGYKMGTSAALSILQGGGINIFISVASVLGLFMMGGLSSSMVKLTTPIAWMSDSGEFYSVQKMLDGVLPGLLPLIGVFWTYNFIMKGNSMTKATLYLLIFGVVTGAIGILGDGGIIAFAKP
ncbi:MAG: PTS system mannose/fructose/sorbose family transporter subunit IID [Clostridia bacterium]|nr:PTS system mannose/fructose/sorbose family transporter subunit IID [Clostridia bacterium]